MVTPNDYKENIKKGIVTPLMLEEVLYSYNKRAKNYRNLARKYRNMYDRYNNEEKCEEKKEQLYEKKGDILARCDDYLKCIHKVPRTRKIRIEDTEDEYFDYLNEIKAYEHGEKSEVVYMNSYYDTALEDFVSFINVYKKVHEFYLYYEFPHYSFHSPIGDDMTDSVNFSMYKHLNIVEIEDLITYGKTIENLLSLQFCDKVWALMKNK